MTKPWPKGIDRRHKPRAPVGRHGYQAFRQCLRWEFGFSCSFCLCHDVPIDAENPCGCTAENGCILPSVLDEQTIEVECPAGVL